MSDTTIGYINANLNDVEAWDGESSDPVNAGEYVVRINKVEGKQSQTGNPAVLMEYQVVEALDDENEDQVDRTFLQTQSLDTSKDGVRRRLKNLFGNALGILDDRGGFDPNAAVGKEILCEIRHETYTKTNPVDGTQVERTSMKVIRERPLDGEEAAPKQQKTASRGRRVTRRSPRA